MHFKRQVTQPHPVPRASGADGGEVARRQGQAPASRAGRGQSVCSGNGFPLLLEQISINLGAENSTHLFSYIPDVRRPTPAAQGCKAGPAPCLPHDRGQPSQRGPGPGKMRDSRAESRVGKSTHTQSRSVVARGWQGSGSGGESRREQGFGGDENVLKLSVGWWRGSVNILPALNRT